jgi:hypothetical protein
MRKTAQSPRLAWRFRDGDQDQGMSRPSLKNPLLAGFLAWLIPGLGHWYQGRRGKAVLYFTCIMGLYLVGQSMGEWKVVVWRWTDPVRDTENFKFPYLCQFWVGLPALPAFVQPTLAKFGIPPILGGLLAEPPIDAIRGLEPRLGKIAEVGWIYTVIAGLLNVLAIYDALEGPATIPQSKKEEAEAAERKKPLLQGAEA